MTFEEWLKENNKIQDYDYYIFYPNDLKEELRQAWKVGYEQGYNDGYAIGEDPPY